MPQAKLIDDQSNLVTGTEVAIGTEGTTLKLELGPGRELANLAWRIRPAEGTDVLTCTYASDTDPVPANALPSSAVNWAIADWGEEQPLAALTVSGPTQGVPKEVQVKLFRAGAWFPLTPNDVVTAGRRQGFPPSLASKIMVEPVAKQPVVDGSPTTITIPEPAQLDTLTPEASRAPYGLRVAVDGGEPLFQLDGPVPGGREPMAVTGLEGAINAWFENHPEASAVPLTLEAEIPGSIRIDECAAETLKIARRLDKSDRVSTLDLPWEENAEGAVTIGGRSVLESVTFRAEAELLPQRILLAPAMTSTRFAHLCDFDHAAAQAFRFSADTKTTLTGIDLYLRPAHRRNRLILALHPDAAGRPGPQPYGTGRIEQVLTLEGDPPYAPRWVGFDCEKPLALTDPAWWLILKVSEGEMHWLLGDSGPEQAMDARYRVGQGPWLARNALPDGTASDTPWAQTRLRTVAEVTPELHVALARGTVTVPISLTTGQMVNKSALARLNRNPALPRKELRLVFSAGTAGKLTISDLAVRYIPKAKARK